MVYLHTGPMGVHRACFFIARAGRAATPERNRSGNQPPILCILPLVAHQLASARQDLLDDSLATGLLPEPLEDQGGSDPLGADDGQAALCVGGEDHDRVGQASPRDQEGIELAAVAELIEPAQGGDDPLPGATAFPAVLND